MELNRIKRIQEFLRTDPNDSFLQHALALEYIKLGDDTRARQLFEEIIKREPRYVGSYYHLAKLLERNDDRAGAIIIYEKGMEQAKQAGEDHAYGELRGAWEELTS